VLADISRSRGDMKEAAKLYAYAIQMDPSNEHYRMRYEEMVRNEPTKPKPKEADFKSVEVAAPMLGVAVVALACIYLAIGREPPVMPGLALVSTSTGSRRR
jgi:hypothetical protein